jgi:predicted lipoprotein with Yx(FWY)xxD motif
MALSTLNPIRRRTAGSLRVLLAAAAIAPLVAACGSSSPSHSAQPTSTPVSKPASTTASDATVATAKVPGYGVALSTGKGVTLFLFTGKGGCTGACAKEWKPLVATGKPSAGTGAKSSLLSTVKLPDGTQQVTYAGHQLYTHPGLSAASVAGTAADGGIWYLVSPTGKAITKTNGNGY